MAHIDPAWWSIYTAARPRDDAAQARHVAAEAEARGGVAKSEEVSEAREVVSSWSERLRSSLLCESRLGFQGGGERKMERRGAIGNLMGYMAQPG